MLYFLKQRYLEWGINAHQISVIENMLPPLSELVPARHSDQQKSHQTLTIGYFGQVNPWKGLDIVLRAFKIAIGKGERMELRVHGINQEDFNCSTNDRSNFLEKCVELMSSFDKETIRIIGRYDSSKMATLMESTDVMVMGSIWYENSPMVIQEAFAIGVPVVAPNYGGMAEKIDHQKTGLLYDSLDAISLASTMISLLNKPGFIAELGSNARYKSLNYNSILAMHLDCYK